MNAEQARAATDAAKEHLAGASASALIAVGLVEQVIDSRGWADLDYASPAAYLLAEFDVSVQRLDPAGRKELALTLVRNGVSRRAAAKALGTDERTVRRDLAPTAAHAAVELPDRVLSSDGRERPAVQPPRSAPAPAEDELTEPAPPGPAPSPPMPAPPSFDEPEPEPDPVGEWVSSSRQVQDTSYLHEFAKAFARSDDFMGFDPVRVGQLADERRLRMIRDFSAQVDKWAARALRAGSSLRVVEGGQQ